MNKKIGSFFKHPVYQVNTVLKNLWCVLYVHFPYKLCKKSYLFLTPEWRLLGPLDGARMTVTKYLEILTGRLVKAECTVFEFLFYWAEEITPTNHLISDTSFGSNLNLLIMLIKLILFIWIYKSLFWITFVDLVFLLLKIVQIVFLISSYD